MVDSILFDADYYTVIYPEYIKYTPLPLLHYIKFGWKSGNNPSPFFNTVYFIAQHIDIVKSGISPLELIVEYKDKRYFMPPKETGCMQPYLKRHYDDIMFYLLVKSKLFDPEYYIANNKDIGSQFGALEHFRFCGWKEGRQPSADFKYSALVASYYDNNYDINPIWRMFNFHSGNSAYIDLLLDGELRAAAIGAKLWDEEFYNYTYGLADGTDSFLNYMIYGWRIGRNPSPWFNAAGYAAKYCQKDDNPILHYIKNYGCAEVQISEINADIPGDPFLRRHMGEICAWQAMKLGIFDEPWYLRQNPDIEQNNMTAMEHYRLYGFEENRSPGKIFDCYWYIERYLHGDKSKCAIYDYLIRGRKKGCLIHEDIMVPTLKEQIDLLLEQLSENQKSLVDLKKSCENTINEKNQIIKDERKKYDMLMGIFNQQLKLSFTAK